MKNEVKIEYAGKIEVMEEKNPRILYEHQEDAISKMDEINKKCFRSLLVLPTGGGKTVTAVIWLLRKAINEHKKYYG